MSEIERINLSITGLLIYYKLITYMYRYYVKLVQK